jgi:tetratricopeptide (TPR) repeat protein
MTTLPRTTISPRDCPSRGTWFPCSSLQAREFLSPRARGADTPRCAKWRSFAAISPPPNNGDRKSLTTFEALGDRPGLATVYHQLGRVAQHRGELAAAEQWYQKSLEIKEALGEQRRGLAATYGQLGLLAERRGDLAAALDWVVRCVALFEEFPHPAAWVRRAAHWQGRAAFAACCFRPAHGDVSGRFAHPRTQSPGEILVQIGAAVRPRSAQHAGSASGASTPLARARS